MTNCCSLIDTGYLFAAKKKKLVRAPELDKLQGQPPTRYLDWGPLFPQKKNPNATTLTAFVKGDLCSWKGQLHWDNWD